MTNRRSRGLGIKTGSREAPAIMRGSPFQLGSTKVIADPSGALILPDAETVVVADLHLEKGSAYAARGLFLPPYDTRVTLLRLEAVLSRLQPRRVISLGDGFHDQTATSRLCRDDRHRLSRLVQGHEWIWLTGNHDPTSPDGIGGRSASEIELGGIIFRHTPAPAAGTREVAGHLHPKAVLRARGRRFSRACFVVGGGRVVLPAFGTYAGGLDIDDPALACLFPNGRTIYALGRDRLVQVTER